MAKARIPAVAYLRTSSAANVGSDKDSEHRHRAAVRAFAKRAGFELADTGWFYDAAVSGADPIEGREGLARLLDRSKAMESALSSSKTPAGLPASLSCRSSASPC